ncbi:MAG: metallophosphoesterase family protein [Candidatus Aenigmarchaeota archaeon]|nr:metallophosphoesterase family protein [Candidatus Aenigmarchaeota archaeon]
MTKKLKILAASDLHGDTRQVKKLAERAYKENVDIVIIAGDITQFDSSSEDMIGPFLKRGKKVLFVPGNHDSPATAEFLEEKYRITNLQHCPVNYKGIGFFGCGGANIGLNQLSEKEIGIYLKNGFDSIKEAEKKIMITHLHPEGTAIEKMSFRGSRSIKKAIEDFKPDIHICGHIHEAEGVEEKIGRTKVFCVGSQGKIIEV